MSDETTAPATEETEDLTLKENFRLLLKASKGFWLVNQINFLDGIAYFGILMLLTRYLGPSGLGMTDQLTGFSVSLYTGLVTLFMFGGGFVSDRLGVRRALTWSLIVIGAGRVILTAAPAFSETSHIAAWTGLMLMALGTGVMQPALYAGIKEYTDPRTATIGYGLLYSIMNLGIVAESFISPLIRSDATFLNLGFMEIVGLGWGINGVYWTAVAITGLMLLVHITFFTKKIEDNDRTVAAKETDENETGKTWIDKLKELPFADPRFMFFIFILLPVRTIFAHDFLTVPDYVFRCFPEAVSAKYEWIHGMNPLIIVIFVPTIAALTRKKRIIDMMILGTFITATIPFILVPGPELWTLLTYVTIYSFGEAVWSSRFLEYVADLAPAGRVGAYMGLAGIPWFMAKFTTGLYSGSMLAHFVPEGGPHNSGTMWFIYACMALASPIGLILAKRWLIKGVKAKGGK
ncbi:MAG: MFS transporter [bacterium]